MNAQDLEKRITALEAEVTELRSKIEKPAESDLPWWEKIRGTAADDEMYDEAMRLGREYRESLRPKDQETE